MTGHVVIVGYDAHGRDTLRASPGERRSGVPVVAERSVLPSEVGRAPAACGPSVVAAVRDGARHWCGHPAVGGLREHDRLPVLGPVPSGAGEVDL